MRLFEYHFKFNLHIIYLANSDLLLRAFNCSAFHYYWNTNDKIKKQALRTVTGAVKTPPIDAMLGKWKQPPDDFFLRKILSIFGENYTNTRCLSLFKKLSLRGIGRPNKVLWKVFWIWENFLIPKPLFLPPDPTMNMVFNISTELIQVICKKIRDTSALKTIALETINTFYPGPDWIHLYTERSLVNDTDIARAGVAAFCSPFIPK